MDQAVARVPGAVLDVEKPALLRLTAEQVGTMCEAGVFGRGNGRIELREGLLHRMSPQSTPHMIAKTNLLFLLHETLRKARSSLRADSEGTIRLDERNLAEPDVMVWEPAPIDGFVPVERVRLAVEVCRTSHADDLGYKPGLYASGGIPEYWIVDLPGRAVHQRWAPTDGAYAQTRVVALGGIVTAESLPGIAIDTTGLLEANPAG